MTLPAGSRPEFADGASTYAVEVDRLLAVARLLESIDCDKILRTIQRAHTIGPLLHPNEYRDAIQRHSLQDVAALTQAARDLHNVYTEITRRYGEEE